MSGSVHLQISDLAPGPLRALNKLPGGHQLCLQLRPLPLPGPFAPVGSANENVHLRGKKRRRRTVSIGFRTGDLSRREANVITTTLRKRDTSYRKTVSEKSRDPPPLSKAPTLNSERGTFKPQALSGTETAAPEGPALGFLLSPEVTTVGPPQAAFRVPHPTQNPQTLSCAA